jgi:hypothetical protein
MQGLWRFAEQHGEAHRVALAGGAHLHIHRVAADRVRDAVAATTT